MLMWGVASVCDFWHYHYYQKLQIQTLYVEHKLQDSHLNAVQKKEIMFVWVFFFFIFTFKFPLTR